MLTLSELEGVCCSSHVRPNYIFHRQLNNVQVVTIFAILQLLYSRTVLFKLYFVQYCYYITFRCKRFNLLFIQIGCVLVFNKSTMHYSFMQNKFKVKKYLSIYYTQLRIQYAWLHLVELDSSVFKVINKVTLDCSLVCLLVLYNFSRVC